MYRGVGNPPGLYSTTATDEASAPRLVISSHVIRSFLTIEQPWYQMRCADSERRCPLRLDAIEVHAGKRWMKELFCKRYVTGW